MDLLLYPRDLAATVGALEEGLLDGSLPEGRVVAALHRYETALARLEGTGAAPGEPPPYDPTPEATADRLLAAPLLRGRLPALRLPLDLLVVDDDVGGPYPASPSTHVAEVLGGRAGSGGSRVVLAFCEPRGWKGRAGFGESTRAELARLAPSADLVVLFGHPRLLAEVPGTAPVLHAWHRQRPMQEAAARRLAGAAA